MLEDRSKSRFGTPPWRLTWVASRAGIDRSLPDWDDGLMNFGYEPVDALPEVALAGTSIDAARAEAQFQWDNRPMDSAAEGYWIVSSDEAIIDQIFSEGEDTPAAG